MMPLLLSYAWGMIVLLSIVALGRIIARVVQPAVKWGFSLAAGWGLACMAILGGLLNLLGAARPPVLISLVISIILLDLLFESRGLIRFVENGPSPPPVPIHELIPRKGSICIVIIILMIIKYLFSFSNKFIGLDDINGYLVPLARLLQTGSIGRDPFSIHQLASLNGQTFLMGLVVSASSLKYAFLLDPGICWFLIGGLTWSIVRRDLQDSLNRQAGSPPAASTPPGAGSGRAGVAPGGEITATLLRDPCIWVGLVLLVKTPYMQNLGGHLTGTVLYLTLVQTAWWGTRDKGVLDRGSLVLLALTLAGLCALKTTFVIFAGFFVIGWYGMRIWHVPSLALLRELSLVGLITSVLLLSWMTQQYLSGGTPLYPYLGRGYALPDTQLSVDWATILIKVKKVVHISLIGSTAPAILGLLLLIRNPFKTDLARWRALSAAMFGAAVGPLGLAFMLTSDDLPIRYSQPFIYAALIAAGSAGKFSTPRSRKGIALALCLVLFVGNQWDDLYNDLVGFRSP